MKKFIFGLVLASFLALGIGAASAKPVYSGEFGTITSTGAVFAEVDPLAIFVDFPDFSFVLDSQFVPKLNLTNKKFSFAIDNSLVLSKLGVDSKTDAWVAYNVGKDADVKFGVSFADFDFAGYMLYLKFKAILF